MAEMDKPEVDPFTGIQTTGHEWDGVTELNQPLPRWWLWIFYATIIFSLGYWVVYPAWPLATSATSGVFGWHSRTEVQTDLDQLVAQRFPVATSLGATPIEDIQADAKLFDFALAYGYAAFGDNCVPCHGAGGGGAVGYPNLIDDDWLWGGSLEAILQTVTYGIRNSNPDSRQADMPAFGRDGILTDVEVATVANYLRSLSGLEVPASADLAGGATLFADYCAGCHGDNGEGNRDLGAPNLADAIWLYGSSLDAIVTTIKYARNSSMPAWGERLDPTAIKALAVYVHSLGGGE
jgi:cytochrome c oxidase cbb3-type subunit 3